MKNRIEIPILIVENDQAQSDLLKNKLLEFNPGYQIKVFQNGTDLFTFLKSGYHLIKNYYLILDYYLHSGEEDDSMTGLEMIKHLNEFYPRIPVIIFSSFDSDSEEELKKVKEEPNVVDYVKRTEYGYSGVQNILRFHYSESSLLRKKKRFRISFVIFSSMLLFAGLYFIISYLSH